MVPVDFFIWSIAFYLISGSALEFLHMNGQRHAFEADQCTTCTAARKQFFTVKDDRMLMKPVFKIFLNVMVIPQDERLQMLTKQAILVFSRLDSIS